MPVSFALLFPAVLLAQSSLNTVTVAATRDASAQPDQAVFSVTAETGIDRDLDDVVKALGGSGITAANLQYVDGSDRISWAFALDVPLPALKSTIAMLAAVQKNVAQRGLTMSFSLQDARSSRVPDCDVAALIADARAQAQKRAAAAGLIATSITGIAGSVPQPDCSLTVTFALGYSGQPGPHAMSIDASRLSSVKLDQVLIDLTVTTDISADAGAANAILARVGIRDAVFTGVRTFSPTLRRTVLEWSFALTTPLDKMKSTLAQIAAARQDPAINLDFYVDGLQGSTQTPPLCDEAGLVADARAQAQKLAAAAGVSLGPVVGVSDGQGQPQLAIADFGYASFFVGFPRAIAFGPSCSLSVQFQIY